jgi:hypothetical protein
MDTDAAAPHTPNKISFRDGLGERSSIVESTSGDTLEAMRLCPALSANFAVERALRERVGRLIEFRHNQYARIWRVEGEAGSPAGLYLVSERPRGMRLAEMIEGIERGHFAYDFQVARSLIEQLVSAIASLHMVGHDVAHGTLGPERLIVTPHAGLVIVEHVLGPALEHLELTRTRLWQDYRVPIPVAAGMPRLDQRADTLQIGVVTLALLLGRRLSDDDFPGRVEDLLDEACQPAPGIGRQPVSRAFGAWLVRVLQLDVRHSFHSAIEARAALEAALREDTGPTAVRLVAAPSLAPASAGSAPFEAAPEVVHQEEVGAHEEAATFWGLDHGSFRAGRASVLARMGRAARHVVLRAAAVLVCVTAVLGLAYFAIDRYAPAWLADHQPTVLTFGSQYAGTEVVIDGRSRGRAPMEVSVTPGPHTVELRSTAKPKTVQPPVVASGAAAPRSPTRK